jgi:hypothetical protein
MQAESGLIADRWEGDKVGVGPGYGLLQWTPYSKLQDWATQQGMDYRTVDTQLARVKWEADNNQQFSKPNTTFWAWLKSNITPQVAADDFVRYYERPAVVNSATRQTYAQNWYNQLKGSSVATSNGGDISAYDFIQYGGNVYRVVGGAPLYISSFSAVAGATNYTSISQSDWVKLNRYPKDGTVVVTQVNGVSKEAFIFAGGAPLYIGSYSNIATPSTKTFVDQAAILNAGSVGNVTNAGINDAPYSHARAYPADGTVVVTMVNGATSEAFKFAGGAPLYISSWANIGGQGNYTIVDKVAITNTTGTYPYNHVRAYPADGAVVVTMANGATYEAFKFAGGAPLYISDWANVGGQGLYTIIDKVAITNMTGVYPYNRTRIYPADGTILRSGSAGSYYSVQAGVPTATSLSSNAIVVDPVVITKHGSTTYPYNHLK